MAEPKKCIGCQREDNLDDLAGDTWCHWCAMEGEASVLAIAQRQAPNGTRATILDEFWKRNPKYLEARLIDILGDPVEA